MAEVVGVVASGINIAQIASQVASSVLKIKTFWDQVKAAPAEINHLLREVESFSLILEHIRDDLARNTLPDLVFGNDCMRQSLELCKTGATELQELAGDLAAKLEGKSGVRMKMNATRIVLKKDDIQSCKRRLKGAIRLLSLAYQCHTNAMIRLQPYIILARLSTTMTASSDHKIVDTDYLSASAKDQAMQTTTSNSTDLVIQCYTHWTTSPSWLRFLFGSLEYNKRKIKRRDREQELHKARYKLPEFISLKTWDVTFYKSLSDWTVNMRIYRTIQYNAPIYRAIEKNDILLVQDLLSSKAAFVTDVDMSGSTLLHASVQFGRFEICKLLISHGADVCASDNYQWTPLIELCLLTHQIFYYEDTQKQVDIARLLVEAGVCSNSNDDPNFILRYIGRKEIFQYFLQQTDTPYYNLTLSERFKIVSSLGAGGWDVEPDTIKLAITPSKIDEEMATLVNEQGETLLQIIAKLFARFYVSNDPRNLFGREGFETWIKAWHMLIKEVISAGACPHSVETDGSSILYLLISTSWYYYSSFRSMYLSLVRRIIDFWLLALEDAGVNLAQYGAHEHTLHISGDVQHMYTCRIGPSTPGGILFAEEVAIHLINFTYGPRPEDWTFCFSEPTDFFAGEFWEMVERSEEDEELELPMPGAWIDIA